MCVIRAVLANAELRLIKRRQARNTASPSTIYSSKQVNWFREIGVHAMETRIRAFNSVCWLSAGLRSESRFFNFGKSFQEAASCLTSANSRLLPRKDHR